MRPRYMTVPSPAPCHINVAGVGKQSVWGLRIIVGLSYHFGMTPRVSQYQKL